MRLSRHIRHNLGESFFFLFFFSVSFYHSFQYQGPSLALRGKTSEDMKRAVDGMKEERVHVFMSGFVSIISFVFTVDMLVWVFQV